jgi:signal transduction histidine kinase
MNRPKVTVAKRLRIVFGTILCLIFISFVVGGIQLYRLRDTQNHAIQYSVPALVESQKLASGMVQFSEVSTTLRTANSNQEISATNKQLNSISDEVSTTLSVIRSSFGAEYIGLSDIEAQFQSLNIARSKKVQHRFEMLRSDAAIRSSFVALDNLRQRFETLLEPRVLSAHTAYAMTLSDLREETKAGTLKGNAFSNLSSQAENYEQLTDLWFRILGLFAKIESISEQLDVMTLNEIRRDIEFSSLGISQLLINVDENTLKTKLATLMKEVRTVSLGQNGLLESSISHSRNESLFRQSLAEQISFMARISEIIQNNVEVLRSSTRSSTESFNKNLIETILILSLLAASIIIVTILVVHYVVEIQLNRRMTQLTSSVTAIANGDIEHQVGLSGEDEIGQMAKALEVFKATDRELRRSNDELEKFAYAASHDLKSPLSSIKTLSTWIKEDSAELSTETQENLDLLISRINRLSTLQTDLLTYAKAGHVDSGVEILDLEHMLKDLSDLLDPNGKFNISSKNSLTTPVKTVKVAIRQILLNLINNAIKHHDRGYGSIIITVSHEKSQLFFEVTDDGPGIDPKYHADVFGLFRTLKPKDVVEGSGLGLSLVKKLVEQHGGAISIDSPRGQRGTTIKFSWPVNPTGNGPALSTDL